MFAPLDQIHRADIHDSTAEVNRTVYRKIVVLKRTGPHDNHAAASIQGIPLDAIVC